MLEEKKVLLAVAMVCLVALRYGLRRYITIVSGGLGTYYPLVVF